MKKHGYSRKLVIVLLTSVSATAALSACGTTKALLDGWTNDREEQVVNGARRVPALNPQYVEAPQIVAPSANPVVYDRKQEEARQQPTVMATKEEPKQEAAKRAPTFEESPYDYFDNEGNPVEPKETSVAGSNAEEGNFFTRLFGGDRKPSEVEKLRNEPRKPLLDNQYAPTVRPLATMTDAAPAQPVVAPLAEPVRPIEMKAEPAPYLAQTEPVATPVTEPVSQFKVIDAPKMLDEPKRVAAMPEPAEVSGEVTTLPPVEISDSHEKPNWFERTFKRIGDQFEPAENTEAPQADAADINAENMDYPELASVPSTPEQFADAKAEKVQKMEDMQSEHMQAEQDKFALYSEPSGVEANVPVDLVKPQVTPMVNKPLVAVPVVAEPVIIPESQNGGEVLLGHASTTPAAKSDDVPVKVELAVPQVAEPVKEEMPAQSVVAEPVMDAVPETQQQKRWWDDWRIFSAESKQPERAAEAPAAEVISEEPSPVVQVPDTKQAEDVPALTPMVAQPVVPQATQPAQANAEVIAPPQVAEAEAAPAEEMEEAKPAAGALPSPQILREVKMLPPSRYSARARNTSTQAQ